jgi:hypothetical protein
MGASRITSNLCVKNQEAGLQSYIRPVVQGVILLALMVFADEAPN